MDARPPERLRISLGGHKDGMGRGAHSTTQGREGVGHERGAAQQGCNAAMGAPEDARNVWERPGECLGNPQERSGPSWAHLGASWSHLGAPSDGPGPAPSGPQDDPEPNLHIYIYISAWGPRNAILGPSRGPPGGLGVDRFM
eukprot:7582090-Pyramimonas_sp.AAC.1